MTLPPITLRVAATWLAASAIGFAGAYFGFAGHQRSSALQVLISPFVVGGLGVSLVGVLLAVIWVLSIWTADRYYAGIPLLIGGAWAIWGMVLDGIHV